MQTNAAEYARAQLELKQQIDKEGVKVYFDIK
jgi:hypothetical protein